MCLSNTVCGFAQSVVHIVFVYVYIFAN